MRAACAGVVMLCGVLACNNDREAWAKSGDTMLRDVVQTGRLAETRLSEASGAAPSRLQPNLYWLLNDSGNEPLLFAIDTTGKSRGVLRVSEAPNNDWETLASGPCQSSDACLYIGDTGDNGAQRAHVRLWRMGEPAPTDMRVPPPVSLEVRYADGAHDVEAMFVAPDTSVWLITKRPSEGADGTARPARVYRIPASAWSAGTAFTASVVDSIAITPRRGDARDFITDASLGPADSTGERRLAVLTYGGVYVFRTDRTSGHPGTLVARCAFPFKERDAEAISWLPGGRVLIANEGRGSRLYSGFCP
jgi:hypothetical protein